MVCLLRFNYGSLRSHHVDKTKNMKPAHDESALQIINVCKDLKNNLYSKHPKCSQTNVFVRF